MKQIPFCSEIATQFNADLWTGMTQRLRQMVCTNSGEHKVNWNTKLADPSHRHRLIKSVGNMVFLRGDGAYDEQKEIDAIFNDSNIFANEVVTSSGVPSSIQRDSHRLFGHEKVVSMLSNNQSQMQSLETALVKATSML